MERRGEPNHTKQGRSAMAMSALRYAARRLGGRALQRPQRSYAAAADVQGGRTVRPTSCRRDNSSASFGAATNSSTEHANPKSSAETFAQKNKEYLASIQQKKIQSKQEELFQLIAKMNRELPYYCSRDNIQLLMHLSVRVQPKPNDPQWRIYRRAFTVNNCILYGGILYLSFLAMLPNPRTRDVHSASPLCDLEEVATRKQVL